MTSMTQRQALVVGGTEGIARAVALRLSAAGHQVTCTREGRGAAPLEPGLTEGADLLGAAPGTLPHPELMVVAPAGPEQLRAVCSLCERVGATMAERGFGRIVLLTSSAGLFGASAPAEAVVEAGTVGLAKSLARALAPRGVTVNVVALGAIDGLRPDLLERVPLRRSGTQNEVSAAVEMLCADAAGYLTGQCLAVDGGLT